MRMIGSLTKKVSFPAKNLVAADLSGPNLLDSSLPGWLAEQLEG
jgi:hypothetical protein